MPKNGGYSPPAWTVLIFPKSSRFRSYFKRARVHVHVQSCTCTCTCTYAHVMSYYMYRCMIFCAELSKGVTSLVRKSYCFLTNEVNYLLVIAHVHVLHQNSFLTHFSSLSTFLNFGEIPAWPFFGKPFFGTRQYCSIRTQYAESIHGHIYARCRRGPPIKEFRP